MSANHARRHRSGAAEIAHIAENRTRRITRLVAARDQLAARAAEASAHELGGVLALNQQVQDLEDLIMNEAPAIYDRLWPTWIRRDAELDHSPNEFLADCTICQGSWPAEAFRWQDPEQAS